MPAGAGLVMIWNLPDLGRTPYAIASGQAASVSQLVSLIRRQSASHAERRRREYPTSQRLCFVQRDPGQPGVLWHHQHYQPCLYRIDGLPLHSVDTGLAQRASNLSILERRTPDYGRPKVLCRLRPLVLRRSGTDGRAGRCADGCGTRQLACDRRPHDVRESTAPRPPALLADSRRGRPTIMRTRTSRGPVFPRTATSTRSPSAATCACPTACWRASRSATPSTAAISATAAAVSN